MRKIEISPVTRIEGHAKISIYLDDAGVVDDARFHVTQFRGFEKLAVGRPFYEMPHITARICGICPVSHLVASAKACDRLLAVTIPDVADRLRRIMNLAQIIQSHALSFFHLSAPDLLLGMDRDPAERHLFTIAAERPQIARDGIRLRQIGQSIIALLGDRRIHPSWIVPGGVQHPLSEESRDRILADLTEAKVIAQRALELYWPLLERFEREIATFANFPTLFLALIGPDDELNHYHGRLRLARPRSKGTVGAETIAEIAADSPQRYSEMIAEKINDHSYLKSPYYIGGGVEDGIYRVGPLARIHVVERCGTALADGELARFRELPDSVQLSSFSYHHARLIEILFAIEKIEEIVHDRSILDRHVRAQASHNNLEGVGISEAPRGTLIHHYRIDENGLITEANMIIATGHNNEAMERGILQAAREFISGRKIEEGALNRLEAVVRAFDPCLSCSTHAFGQMPLEVELRSADGLAIDRITRSL